MRLLLISSSIVHGYGYLDHAEAELRRLLEESRTVSRSCRSRSMTTSDYTGRVRERSGAMGFDVTQVRETETTSSAPRRSSSAAATRSAC